MSSIKEHIDTDNIHDNVTNSTRLTIPGGVTKVMLAVNLDLANVPNLHQVATYKNGGIPTCGLPVVNIPKSPDVRTRINLVSALIIVSAGDHFEVPISSNAQNIFVDHTWPHTWFSMEISK
jgi:hypothetical protein